MSDVPRAQAIDGAWRRIGPGVQSLSTPDGGPLSRTVKLILLPLVLRPAAHPELAATLLGESGVLMVDRLVAEHRPQLLAAARWFALLVERSATWQPAGRIARDSCYAKAFELAVTRGDPRERDAKVLVEEALDELADARGDWTPAALRRVLAEPGVRSSLAANLVSWWDETPVPDSRPVAAGEDGLGESEKDCRAFLETFSAGGETPAERLRRSAEQAWASILDAQAGCTTGWRLRADRWPTLLAAPARARRLGLTEAAAPVRPELESAARSGSRRPWDRSIEERVLSLVRHSTDPTVLPEPAELLADEVERACGPWELAQEPSRAVLLLGTVLAIGLTVRDGGTSAHRIVAGMRRRESWLSWAQRQPVVAGGAPEAVASTGGAPEPSPVASEPVGAADAEPHLAALAAELADPVAPYVRRLWVRVHGAEARGTLPTDVVKIQSLLVGVFRSVLLDGRSRIRAALTRLQGERR